jgi:hypothetical protein
MALFLVICAICLSGVYVYNDLGIISATDVLGGASQRKTSPHEGPWREIGAPPGPPGLKCFLYTTPIGNPTGVVCQ